MIKLASPAFDDYELKAVCEVLTSGNLVQGRFVAEFENAISNYLGVNEAIAVSSGTAALHLSLLAIGVTPGDIVLTTSYSFIATANVIELCGAHPLFIDINPRTYNIDCQHLANELERLNRNDKLRYVKAIIPVHTFGQLADMREVCRIADMYSLPVIEDAACALGASLLGKKAGNWGHLACFSFHPRKILTTGEGGMIVTNDSLLASRMRLLRNHGQQQIDNGMDYVMPGFNYRLTEMQAILGLGEFNKLNQMIDRRRGIAARYNEMIKGASLIPPSSFPGSMHVYQSYIVMLPDKGISRSEIIKYLKEKNIETTIGTVHIPMTSYYRQRYCFDLGDFPVTDEISERTLSLPIHELITEENQSYIVKSLIQKIEHP